MLLIRQYVIEPIAMRALMLCLTLNMISGRCYAQKKADNFAYTEPVVNLDKLQNGDKSIPFDQPFWLILDNANNITVNKIFIFRIKISKNIKSLWKNTIKADFQIKDYDTAGRKISIHMPALKPNLNFNIQIQTPLTIEDKLSIFQIVREINAGNAVTSQAIYQKLKARFQDTSFGVPINSWPYGSKEVLYGSLNVHFNILQGYIDRRQYHNYSQVSEADMIQLLTAAQANKLWDENLTNLNNPQKADSDIAKGFVSLEKNNTKKVTDVYNVYDRIKLLESSIRLLSDIQDKLQSIYLISNNSSVKIALASTSSNLENLQTNKQILQNFAEQFDRILRGLYLQLWVLGSTLDNNLSSKGGSILSTELGISSLFVNNNLDERRIIPKLYGGLDIFFRPVNRNLSLEHLPRKLADQDGISARRGFLHHFSLSVGLTFGGYDQSDFDNLYNGMSLMVGPSYRFLSAFRISAGAAFLKRKNPNPIKSEKQIAYGYYMSTSIDFDLFSTVSSITGRIFK